MRTFCIACPELQDRRQRAAVQAGQPFPIPTGPTTDWYDGQPIAGMDAPTMP